MKKPKVIFSSPTWSLNGVNIFTANLARGLKKFGFESKIVLTMPEINDRKVMPLPKDITTEKLVIPAGSSWQDRWQLMTDYLKSQEPCIYFPNYDFRHGAICPSLPSTIGVVGILHSDDPLHYDQGRRIGKYCNALVCVSDVVKEKFLRTKPGLDYQPIVIHYGVEVPDKLPVRNKSRMLNLVYAGRIETYQKRVLDLIPIIRELEKRGIPVGLKILGDGKNREQFVSQAADLIDRRLISLYGVLPNKEVIRSFKESDAIIFTSDFEGMPIALLEAMSVGCVPVVTDIKSGIPELITQDRNGFRVPVGDITGFANRLEKLYNDKKLSRQMSKEAYETIHRGDYSIAAMSKSYAIMINKVWDDIKSGSYIRKQGKISPPFFLHMDLKSKLIFYATRPKRLWHDIRKFILESNNDWPLVWPDYIDEIGKYRKYLLGKVLNAGSGHRILPVAPGVKVYNLDLPTRETSLKIDIKASLDNIPIRDNYFDSAICNAVLEHLPTPQESLREIYRVLRPGGHLYLTVPFMQIEHKDPSDYQRYTKDGLVSLAELVGFEVISVEGVHTAYHPLAQIVHLWLTSDPGNRWFWLLRQIIYPILRYQTIHSKKYIDTMASAYCLLAIKPKRK